MLLNDLLIPKVLRNPLPSCSVINLNFLLLYKAHFDNSIILLVLIFITFGFTISVLFLNFKLYINIFSNGFDYSARKTNDLRLAKILKNFFKKKGWLSIYVVITFWCFNFLGPMSRVCFLQHKQYISMLCDGRCISYQELLKKLLQHRFILQVVSLVVFY